MYFKELPLIEPILTWSGSCVITYNNAVNHVSAFTITETNLNVPAVTLSTQDNAKLLSQLRSRFKITSSWNKYVLEP